jgi:hypothetical protein
MWLAVLTLISELQARIKQANDAMPGFVKTDPEQLLDDVQHSVVRTIPGCDAEWQPIDVMYLIAIHCGMRHTDFLLERALVLRKQLDSRRLVPSARNLLRLVLRIAMMKDYCSDFQKDLTGLVSDIASRAHWLYADDWRSWPSTPYRVPVSFRWNC